MWVGAYVRRCSVEGAIATVVRRGSNEAGVIAVVIDRLDGTADLYMPAPQSVFDDAHPGDRLFQRVIEKQTRDAVSAHLEREKRFDPDIWVVEVDDRAGRSFLDLARE